MHDTFGSTCHGAGRARSRNNSRNKLDYQEVLDALKTKGIAIRVASPKLVMEEAPESYKVSCCRTACCCMVRGGGSMEGAETPITRQRQAGSCMRHSVLDSAAYQFSGGDMLMYDMQSSTLHDMKVHEPLHVYTSQNRCKTKHAVCCPAGCD